MIMRAWRRGLLALALGLGGGMFFWLPSLVERGAVQFERANSAWPFLYSNNFLPLSHFLAAIHRADPALINDWPPRALGLLLLGAALIGAGLGWRRRRWLVMLLLAGLAGYSFLILPLSRFLWDMVTPLSAFQFPWRFLAPATMIAAFLAGGVGQETQVEGRHGWWGQSLWLGAILLLSAGHWGWFYPSHCPAPKDTTLEGMVAWEQVTRTTGTTAKDEYRPVAVERKPQAMEPPVWLNRFPAGQLPAGARLQQAAYDALGGEVIVETTVPFTATYQMFAFPGMGVKVNGRDVPITPSSPAGLITFPVPVGASTIEVSFGGTPIRWLADVLSGLSLLLLLGVVRKQQTIIGVEAISGRLLTKEAWWGLLGVACLLLGAKWGLVDREVTLLRQSRLTVTGGVQGVAVERPLLFGAATAAEAKMALLGHEALETVVDVGDYIEFILYWRSLAVAGEDYRVGLTLLDEEGVRWSESGLRESRWYRQPPPTGGWPSDGYALTAYWLDVLPGTPPGEYTVHLSLFEAQTLMPLTIYDEQGQALGPSIPLGMVTLRPVAEAWLAEVVSRQYALEACGSTVVPCLWGSNIDRAEAAPGDTVLVTLFWSGKMREVGLALVDEQEKVITTWPVLLPMVPSGLWRQQQLVRLPVDLADGVYRWQGTYDEKGETAVVWGELRVQAPERLLTQPEVALPIRMGFEEEIELIGVTTSQEGDELVVTLVWQGQQVIPDSYHVFLHLVEPGGTLLTQSDGMPGGNRPTTGWLPGEYVLDEHRLTLSPGGGDYTLRVGLYKPGGRRLLTDRGEDGVVIDVE